MKKIVRKLKRNRDSYDVNNLDEDSMNQSMREVSTNEISELDNEIRTMAKRVKLITECVTNQEDLINENAELDRENQILEQQKVKAKNFLMSVKTQTSLPNHVDMEELKIQQNRNNNELRRLEDQLKNLDLVDNMQLKKIQDRIHSGHNEQRIEDSRSNFENQMKFNGRRTPSLMEWTDNWTNLRTERDLEEQNLQTMVEEVKVQQQEILAEKERLRNKAREWQIKNNELQKRNDDFNVQLFRQENITNRDAENLNLLTNAINHRKFN